MSTPQSKCLQSRKMHDSGGNALITYVYFQSAHASANNFKKINNAPCC